MNIMKMKLLLSAALLLPLLGFSQLEVKKLNTPYRISFDGTVNGVNRGVYQGNGWVSNPGTGQLDSDAWEYTGMSDGNLGSGGTANTGDAARGISNGFVTTGGFYAFNTNPLPGGNADYCLGWQPDGTDMTPGTITLRVENTTGDTINVVNFSYEAKYINNENRRGEILVAVSDDGVTYRDLPTLEAVSPQGMDASPEWTSLNRSAVVDSVVWEPNSFFFFQWTTDDRVNSSGNRDELGIDDITVLGFDADFVWDGAVWSPSQPSGLNTDADVLIFPNTSGTASISSSSTFNRMTLRPGSALDADGVNIDVADTAFLMANGFGYSQMLGCVSSGTTVYSSYLLSDSTAYWYNIAFPVDATLGDISGVKVNANGNPNTTNIWYYDASIDTNSDGEGEFIPAASLAAETENIGYQIYLGDGTFFGFGPFTLSTAGTMLCGDQTVNVSAATADDFNLLANPYPSQLNWDLVTADAANGELAGTYYIQDGTFSDNDFQYRTYNTSGSTGVNGGTQFLPPGQSFFVQLQSAVDTQVVFRDSHRSIAASGALYRTTASADFVKLMARNDATDRSDETVVAFVPNGNDNFERKTDAKKKMNSGFPNLYSELNNDALVYNILDDQFTTKSVDVGFDAEKEGAYTISVSGENLGNTTAMLEDKLLGTMTDIRSNTYNFTHAKGNSASRFTLHFAQTNGVGLDEAAAEAIFAFVSNGQLGVDLGELPNADIQVIDAAGRQVAFKSGLDGVAKFNTGQWAKGVYIVKVSNAGRAITTEKVILH